jgi:putative nucleotidyltransferase with HDIG domain
MLEWLFSLLRKPHAREAAAPPRALASEAVHGREPELRTTPRARLPVRAPGLGLDHARSHAGSLAVREQAALDRIGERIDRGQFELPQLPSTSLAAIESCARPNVEIRELVRLIEGDPVLSSALLRTANSAAYAAAQPVETLDAATMRIGLRSLRSMLYSISVRGAILSNKSLGSYAEEVWRQASSMAAIARALATPLRLDPERAYLIGLLHDIGKLPLLGLLGQEKDCSPTQALVGRLFLGYHEAAGAALARAWKLPAELGEVAGNHHDFASNESHVEAAALASLVHKLDLFLSLDAGGEYGALVRAGEMDCLEADEATRHEILQRAREAFERELTASSAC